MLTGQGGFVAYLGTQDGIEVVKRIEEGDKKAALIQEALAYQVAKEIASMSAVLKGQVNAIILTGGLAYNQKLTDMIKEAVLHVKKTKEAVLASLPENHEDV